MICGRFRPNTGQAMVCRLWVHSFDALPRLIGASSVYKNGYRKFYFGEIMMKTFLAALLACFSLVASVSTYAGEKEEAEKAMMMQLKKMDANGDGVISKEEFMKYQEARYDAMKKNKDGMVDMAEMKKMTRTYMRNI